MVVTALLWLALVALIGPAGFDGVGAGDLAAMSLHLALFGLLFAALAYAVGAATGSRALALGVSAGVAVLGYLANSVFPQVQGLEWVRNLSPFAWLLGGSPLVNGVQVGHAVTLALATAVLVAGGTWAFTDATSRSEARFAHAERGDHRRDRRTAGGTRRDGGGAAVRRPGG